MNTYSLDPAFLAPFQSRTPDMSVPAYITYLRTYAATKPDGSLESWYDTCKRVIEGAFSILTKHSKDTGARLDWTWLDKWAQVMFTRMFEMKWVPAGRGLQYMGRESMWTKGGAVLNSCAFASTKHLEDDLADPFAWLMDMSMLGVGVGFDVMGAGRATIVPPTVLKTTSHVVPDTREGWVGVLARILRAFGGDGDLPASFDFSQIRPEGAKLGIMGGIASGPKPLIQMVWDLFEVLAPAHWNLKLEDDGHLVRVYGMEWDEEARAEAGYPITSEQISDIANIAGKCVVSGGIRRSAEIGLAPPDDRTFRDIKRTKRPLSDEWRAATEARFGWAPETRNDAWRWAANNSFVFDQPMSRAQAQDVADSVAEYGDPGIFSRFLARTYGRLKDGVRHDDFLVEGCNPCGEQPLENKELCNLIEIASPRHESLQDFLHTCTCAYLYGKIVSLLPTHCPEANAVIRRNRRMGVSMTGLFKAYEKFGRAEMIARFDAGYGLIRSLDRRFSKMLRVPASVRLTSLKPSGTVSLVLDVPSGLRADEAPHYIRRIRFEKTSPLVRLLADHGYKAEQDSQSPNSMVVEFPVNSGCSRGVADVSAAEQMSMVEDVQTHWSDNMVSNTIQFQAHERAGLGDLIYNARNKAKSLSFLSYDGHKYVQAPFEAVSKEQYDSAMGSIVPLDYSMLSAYSHHDTDDKGCDGAACAIGGGA